MDEDEDDYIYVGTPLPEIEDEIVLRKKAAREHEVRDEKGRQRFHGAFTGGFSAGFFNTVGTKEGWAPSSFVSSRNKVAEHVAQNPEDFMDEEDLGEFGIASRHIHTTVQFKDSSDIKTRKRKLPQTDNVIPGEAPLKELVKPVKESIGIEILKNLGWKLGQGIGPRVKKTTTVKIYGCSPFPDQTVLEEDDPTANMYTFAPSDTNVEVFNPKDDVFGLGYCGLSKTSILSAQIDVFNPTATKSWLKKDKKKLTISGQAFGVGAFEEDDEDIYGKDDMTQYDFSELQPRAESLAKDKKNSRNTLNSTYAVLEGFCQATKPPPIKKHYAAPTLPSNFVPVHCSVSNITSNTDPGFKPRHNLSAEGRSLLLGEKKFQPFQIEKQKIDSQPAPIEKPASVSLPAERTHSFRPFPNDEQKQKRYEDYVKLKATEELEKLVQPALMTEWEKQQEQEEFSRAATLFRPLSAVLRSKFESKSHLDVEHEVMDAIAKAKEKNAQKSKGKQVLIGIRKRQTIEWHPASLLCKRFNVPNPYPNSADVTSLGKRTSLFDHISFERVATKPDEQQDNNQISVPTHSLNIANNESENKTLNSSATSSRNNTEITTESAKERPSIDFFKDIFENSSSDEESNTPDDTSSSEPHKTVPISAETNVEKNVEIVAENKQTDNSSNKKAGFGVFANIDLDALNRRLPAKRKVVVKEETVTEGTSNDLAKDPVKMTVKEPTLVTDNSVAIFDDLYGPALPPNYNASSSRSSPLHSEHKKHAKHKSKHKHKHQKHKSKKKKKRKSYHESSHSSSVDTDEDLPPDVLIEKIKKLQKVLKP